MAPRRRGSAGRFLAVLALALPLLAAPAQARAAAAGPPVIVSSKIDTEGSLLGSMIAASLAAHGIPVTRRLELGPTPIVRRALLAGQIDIYPEYTGNGAFFFHLDSDPLWKNAQQGYAKVKALDLARNHLVWLTPAPANNTWAIALRHDVAARLAHPCMEEFARYVAGGGRIKLAASAEFVESPAALPSFEATYHFHLTDAELLTLSGGDTSATLRAAAESMSGVNAAMAYGTDGALAALHLVALCDDKGAEIVYAPAPVVRETVLARYPGIATALDPIFETLTLATLQRLNAEIAVDGKSARSVATAYLKSRHLLP